MSKKSNLLRVTDALQIPGWTNRSQHNNYKILAKQLPKNAKVFEIGCGWGRSTWAWLDALPSCSSYYILDCFRLDQSSIQKANPKFAKRAKKYNLNQKQIFDNIIKNHYNFDIIKCVWNMFDSDWLKSDIYTPDWDLVYIDANHSYPSTKRLLETFKNVKIICGDDYNEHWPGVVRAVDLHAEKYKFTKEIMDGSLFVLTNDN